jgi:hypothetical protein
MEHGDHSKREVVLLQDAFYGGARSVLMVLAHMINEGELDKARKTILRLHRQTKAVLAGQRKPH